MITYFPRGPGPLVSILIPTRGRAAHLCHALDSLYSLAMDTTHLETILKIDDDDKETIEAVKKLEKAIPIKKIISPRGRGFYQMHEYVNEMCKLATGDWLFLFNDDARMKTEKWDKTVLLSGSPCPWPGINKVVILVGQTINRPFAQEFIFMRRGTYELLGHFSLSPHNDNWIYSIMRFLGCEMVPEIHIEHLSDVIGDKTREESEKAYKTTIHTLISMEAKRKRLHDLHILLDYMEKEDKSRIWLDGPTHNDWWWWKPPLKLGEKETFEEHVLFMDNKVGFFDKGVVNKWAAPEDLGGKWAVRR